MHASAVCRVDFNEQSCHKGLCAWSLSSSHVKLGTLEVKNGAKPD